MTSDTAVNVLIGNNIVTEIIKNTCIIYILKDDEEMIFYSIEKNSLISVRIMGL